MAVELSIKCIAKPGAQLPEYATAGAAGADICAFLKEPIFIPPRSRRIIPTGLSFEIPAGYEIQVRPRSGLAAKNGVTVLNSPGTIDSDYRGEVNVILYNSDEVPFYVEKGMRIAQIVVVPVLRAQFLSSNEISQTARGAGGFGSTGV